MSPGKVRVRVFVLGADGEVHGEEPVDGDGGGDGGGLDFGDDAVGGQEGGDGDADELFVGLDGLVDGFRAGIELTAGAQVCT